ncbi:unnamed protein product [Cylicocyclus nassatus]|uniref:RNA-directed DNA polymerase n=1 Tax=Cylicocyclus nassatus TaxID=53992 RepID=A0AA36MGH6_CYLNA|nr:unnamed protein product [Cylicocyclus nassatus]
MEFSIRNIRRSRVSQLVKDKAKFEWGSRQQQAFDRLRNKLMTKPCLAFPQERDFILHTDGSQTAVGAALFQQSAQDEKSLVAIGYYSKALSQSQQKWSPTHIELFAMVSALRFFKATIYGLLTRIFSDHIPEADKADWLKLAEDCHIRKNGCLYHLAKSSHCPDRITEQLFQPEKLCEPVFQAMHSSSTAGGHFNWRKTLTKISRKYFWPHMSEQIFALSKTCDPCQRKRAQARNREELLPVVSTTIFDKVYMDLTGPLHTSESGNNAVT